MKKKLLVSFISCCLFMVGCKKANEPSTQEHIIYSSSSQINIHALLNEKSHNLKNYIFVTENNEQIKASDLDWTATDSVVSVDKGVIKYNAEGYTQLTGKHNNTEYKINVLVNKKDRHLFKEYKGDNLSSYSVKEGNLANVIVLDNQITLDAFTNSSTVKVDFSLPEGFNQDYIVEADLTVNQYREATRWTGIVFRSSHLSRPYYQMDVRYNAQASNGVECTEMNSSGAYVYPYIASYKDNFELNKSYHLKVEVNHWNAKFYIDNNLVVDTTLNNLTKGNFGFQANQSNVTYSNIKVSMTDNDITHTENGNSSFVDDKLSLFPTLPKMIVGSSSVPGIGELFGESKLSSVYLKAKYENKNIVLQTMNGENYSTIQELLPLIRGYLVPVIEIDDVETAKQLGGFMLSVGHNDATIISSSLDVLKTYKQVNPVNRIGYITSKSSYENYTEIAEECKKIGSLGGNIVIMDAANITKNTTVGFISRGYALWAMCRDGSPLNIMKSVVNGALAVISENKADSVNAYTYLKSNALLRKPVITGHRGDGTSVHYPENSLESLLYAADAGAQAVEIDVHLTSDKEVVIMHDGTTDRTTTCSLTIAQSTVAQVTACSFRANPAYKVPTFRKVLEAFQTKDTIFVIEFKDYLSETVEKTIALLKEFNMMDRAVFISFSNAPLYKAKQIAPEIAVGFLGTVNVKTFDDYRNTANTYFSRNIGLSPNLGTIDTVGVANANLRGNIFWAWTFGNNQEIFNKINMGNLCFTTNYPADSSNWDIELVTPTEYNTNVGGSLQLNMQVKNYLNKTKNISNYTIKVVSGNDVISINNNQISANKAGDAYIIVEYGTTLTYGSSSQAYSIYSDLIHISVK